MGKMGGHVELHGAPPCVAVQTLGGPHEGLPWPPSPSTSLFTKALKGGFPKISIKLIFTIHDDIFQRPFELKIFMWAQNISSTH